MPSPFPGMDPFLEHPDHFPNLHNQLITHSAEAIQALLPAPYFAKTGRRAWLEYGYRYVEPDVSVHRGTMPRGSRSQAGAAVLDLPLATAVVVDLSEIPQDECREPFLEIYTGRGEDKRLVTSIEILSPSNKTPGNQGLDLYLRKQRELLGSQVHLVEIDLLRGGRHVTTVPRTAALARTGGYDYHICTHRFDERQRCYVYPIELAEALPRIAIPLLPGDGDVTLDLQAVFTRCYDAGPYGRKIDYQRDEPEPPLTPEQATWAKDLLRKAGDAIR